MAHTSEKAFNALLAQALEWRHPRWKVNAEQSGVLTGQLGKVPDIVITVSEGEAGSPVLIETEYEPASRVDADARSRLGLALAKSGYVIEHVVALRVPARLADVSPADLPDEIAKAEFGYRLLSARGGAEPVRFPSEGWIRGTVDDLAGFCERIALNEHLLDSAVALLEETVNSAALRLRTALMPHRQAILEQIADTLHQTEDHQTTCMGVAIIANALLFQTTIAGSRHLLSDGSEYMIPVPEIDDSREKARENWDEIIKVNYWPIFAIAHKVLTTLPHAEAKRMIKFLTNATSQLADYGVTSTGDMAGQMFGKLIADRKFLATFYTLPSSAHLLAELAAARLDVDYADPDQVASLRVADLACGTGTLLTAAYQRIMTRVRRAGSDDKDIHPKMMEQSMIGADIMPAAVHLTATLLSSAYPACTFDDTKIFLMPYGRLEDKAKPSIGSLEMLSEGFNSPMELGAKDRSSIGGTGQYKVDSVLDHQSADLVIMNPPFTRATGQEANAIGTPVPAFAGFGTNKGDQKLMSDRLTRFTQKLPQACGHGNAGLASYFLDLAHIKVKPGGTIAFVLPFTVTIGTAWAKARELLAKHYKDINIVAIANSGSTDRAFSSDTGMAEVLIIATRRQEDDRCDDDKILFVNIYERPTDPIKAVEQARRITLTASETSESKGSGSIDIGDIHIGNFIWADIQDTGCAGITQIELATFARSLTDSKLSLPRLKDITDFALVKLGELGERGPYHMDINGWQADKKTPRGPFDLEKVSTRRLRAYPILWEHDARNETHMVLTPDHEGIVRPGLKDKALQIWDTASRLHLNRDFRLNSQPLAACFTDTPCIGGRAWPTFKLHDENWDKTIILWANTTLGLISFWWVGSLQQQGRSILAITRLSELVTLDPRSLTDNQLILADEIFTQFREKTFLPANEIWRDENRRLLDEAVFVDLLGFNRNKIMPSLAILRDQWCREPSVHGGKSTRPQD